MDFRHRIQAKGRFRIIFLLVKYFRNINMNYITMIATKKATTPFILITLDRVNIALSFDVLKTPYISHF